MLRSGSLSVLIFVCVMARVTDSQTAGSNVPDSPLWPLFSELLSTQTGRTVQDINILGLSDPTINQLWTAYSATMASMSQAPQTSSPPPGTTPPPLPDLYQTSYSFSSTANNQAPVKPNPATGTDTMLSYTQILSLINKLSGGGSTSNAITQPASNTPQVTSTSAQDVMNAYAQLPGGSSVGGSSAGGSSVGGSAAGSGTDYQALLRQYTTSGGKAAESLSQMLGITGASQNSAASGNPSYQVLLDQYNNIMKQGPSASATTSGGAGYEQLLQQYNQIMSGKSTGTSGTGQNPNAISPASLVEQYKSLMSKTGTGGTATNSQLLQMYADIMNGQNTGASSTQQTTTTPAPVPASPQEIFEKQLATLFPQFNSPVAQTSAGNSTAAASNSATSNTAQMIFDALLFAPVATTPPTPAAPVVQEPTPNAVQNLVNARAGAQGLLNDHVQNVFKTRASREMGCRFLPELLELEVMATAPINCMNRCPFPYVNSQKFGVYCVCCPPGVNEHTVGMMSIVRGSSYMETPLAVVS